MGVIEGSNIIVINHSDDLLDLYAELLSEEGYIVSTQTVFDPDLTAIAGLAPVCIIIDYFVRGDPAEHDVLSRLMTDERTRAIPLIVCTGAVRDIEDLRDRLEAESVEIILKPFEIDQLLATIENVRPRIPRS